MRPPIRFAFGRSALVSPPVSDPDRIEKIDRYEIRAVLGQGAMGHVYRAWDPKLHRDVALKVVAQNLSRDPKGRQRFHREARAIAALKHPNIVEIYDYSGVESEHLYLVMEKLDGDDLFNIMNSKGIMPEPAAAAVGHELCLALQVAHEAGIIHRDLKPENVFMNAAGRVVLTDFGVVKAIREDSAVDGWSADTDVIGTPGFMAPELMMNRALGPRTDIFALGALLYNVATGELPYKGESPVEMFRAVVAGEIQDARQFNPQLSPDFIDIMVGCLQAKPKKRFRSVEVVRERLKAVLEANGVSDLRDDLRDYMRDPQAYAGMTRRRAVSCLLQRLKIAIKDKNPQAINQLRERLLEIDPDNDEVHAISGAIVAQGGKIAVRRDTERVPRSRAGASGGGWLYVVVGVLAGLAVLLAAYLVMQPRPLPQGEIAAAAGEGGQQPGVAADGKEQRPAGAKAVRGEGQVEVSVRGGRGSIYVDGKRVGRGTRKSLRLTEGRHVIEIRGNGKRLRQTIDVQPDAKVNVVADVGRGKVGVGSE